MDAVIGALGGWTPLLSILLISAVYAMGERITALTKGYISSMMVASVTFIILYLTKIIPTNVPANSTLGTVAGAFGTFVVVTHLGTVISFKEFLKEWKTVVICLSGMAGIIAFSMLISARFFGRMEAYTAMTIIGGGIVAGTLSADIARANGFPEMAAFVFLIMSFKSLIGMPIASFFLKRECDARISRGDHLVNVAEVEGDTAAKPKLFKPVPPEKNSWLLQLTKLALVAWMGVTFAWFLTKITGSTLFSPAVMVLFFGILFHELGFLDDNIANKAGVFNVLMLAVYHSGPANFATLDVPAIMRMAVPLIGVILVGACGIITFALVASRPLKVTPNLAIACGLAAMFGFPGTLILTTDAVKGAGLPEDQFQNLMDQLLPRMIIAGFTTVTVSSVILAGFIAPMIFK